MAVRYEMSCWRRRWKWIGPYRYGYLGKQARYYRNRKSDSRRCEVVYGDSGYLGVQKRSEIQQSEHFSKVDFRINRRPKSLPKVSDHAIDWERYIEHRKSSIRSKVEHVFRIIECQFGYKKVVYHGLKKNENRLYALFACANLYSLVIAGRKLSTT